jgi:hypothetical protein
MRLPTAQQEKYARAGLRPYALSREMMCICGDIRGLTVLNVLCKVDDDGGGDVCGTLYELEDSVGAGRWGCPR